MPESTTPTALPSINGAPANGDTANGKSKKSSASNGNGADGNGHAHESNGTVVTDPDEIGASELEATEVARVKQSSLPGSGSTGWTPGFRSQTAPDRALKFARHFTQSGQDPFSTSQWERRTASITGENGKSVFEQKDCEIPASWSQLATNVVVSKYFRGPMGTPQRETSVRQVIGRVADTISDWGKQGGYFASEEDNQAFRDELVYLLLHQYGAFNSPVWFNLGVKGARQQASACQPYDALVSTPSGLVPIGELVERNAVGAKVFDAHGVARIVAVKENGVKTVLRVHTKAGYTLDVTGDHLVWKATGAKSGQWVEAGTLKAGDALQWHRTPVVDKSQELSGDVSEAALMGWLQSDGFVGRYEGTNSSLTIEAIVVNAEEEAWVRAALEATFPSAHSHTRGVETQNTELDCKRIRVYGEFLAPFIEKWGLLARRHEMRVPSSLFTAPLSVVAAYLRSLFQAEGYVCVRDNAVVAIDMMGEEMMRGVQKLLLRFGIYSRLRRKEDARPDRAGMWSLGIRTLGDRELFAQEIGFIGQAKATKLAHSLKFNGLRASGPKRIQIERIEVRGEMPVFDIQTSSGEYLSGNIRVHNCFINSVHDDMESIMELAATEARLFKGGSGAGTNLFRIRSSREQLSGGGIASGPVSFMRGWDAFAGAIKSGGTCLAPYQRVYTESGPVAVEELAKRDGFITLSFDPPANRYKAKRARAWLAGRKRVVRVETDKGQFDLSFDHPVKLSSGEYVRAGDLKEGQSLFACSIDSQHGHVRVHLRDGQKGKEFLHRLIAGDVLGHELEGLVVHHCNGDKGNNAPDNLEVMTQAQHAALHGRETALRGEHIFQTGDFSHAGSDNGMHRDGTFWTSEAADSYRELQSDILVRSGRAAEMQREAARQKTLNTAFRVLNAGWPIETFEQYARGRKVVIGRIASLAQLREQLDEEFGSYDEFRREVTRSNHRVVGVSTIGEMDVYDVEVECPTPDDKSPQTGHNFLIWHGEEPTGSGVIVANTRRAAKMVILNADHPDIAEFITCKANEEKKAWALIDAGYNGGFNVPGGAYDSVAFQNANHSVRVTDEFMRAAENGASWSTRAVTSGAVVETLNARDLLTSISETTHLCGDPGLQYDTTLNDWHTCPNSGRINASNPCCVTGDTLVAVADGRVAVPIKELVGTEVPVFAHDHATGKTTISRMWNIGVKRENVAVFRVTLDDGTTFRATDDHLIMLRDGSYRMVRDLSAGDSLMPFHSKVLAPQKNRTKRRYIWNGASWTPQYRALWNFWNGEQPVGTHIHHADFKALNDAPDNLVLLDADEHNALHVSKMVGDNNPARRLMSDEWRGNIARAVSGERNPNFGKTHSDAAKAQMSGKAKARFESREERDLAAQRALGWMEEARAQGRKIGRTPKEREVRCCPICRENFPSARETQVFCSNECRQSLMGRAMIGAKGGAAKAGRTVSPETRAKLSASVSRASNPAQKSQAGRASNRASALKAARLLLDNGVEPAFDSWDALRLQARALGAKRVPRAATLSHLFACESEFQEAATLYNHKVASVEACGFEDVYDGTVDTHHNFAILTSAEDSCAKGQQNFSGIFIHNSEFVFLDDTACNLASINLLKFYDFDTGHFDARSYVHTSETFLMAQEIIVSFASYPTAKIAENSELFRPLGLGYCNIGALLMAMGLAYDSDEGRAFAGALTAIMTGAAYRQSAKIARNTGAFEGYALNREPMLRVIGKHRDAVGRINSSLVAPNVMEEARSCWDEALLLGQKYGYRNSQVTVLAPTGTISFMMDADTTGVEPDIALVKYKKLVGGGLLKIVNQTVPAALRKLGYDENEIATIVEYIDKNDTIEGAPGLEDKHLSVFDCAFKAMNGVRSIHHMGHVKMMAAAQPFLSGAISKCVTGDTLIASTEGMFPIGSLYRGEKPGEFGDIEATLASISEPQRADLFYYGGLRPTKRALLADGRKIEGTWNHRVKVAGASGYDWKRMDDLEAGDFVSVRLGASVWASQNADLLTGFAPSPLHTAQKRIELPAKMTPQLARFLGQYIAEGNKTASNYMVRVTNLNPDVLAHCAQTVREQFSMEGRIETDRRNGVTSFVVASKTLCEFLDHIGAGGDSSSKQIPWSVLRSSEECVREFIGGLWLDGYVRSDGMTAICLNSPELLRQLQVVLNNFGLRAHIIQKYNAPYDKHFGELGMHGADSRRFARLFRLDDAHKTEALEALCDKPKRVHSVYSDVIPAFKDEVRVFIKERRDTQRFRHLFDARTKHMAWHSVQQVADFYGEDLFQALPELREILENNIHFVAVKTIEDDYSAVYDFQIPTNHAFLGNSIINHNTVNMPQDCTMDEIRDAYIQSWKMGVKAVAIYRDNSKRTQPLSTSSDAQKADKKESEVRKALRRKLPDERMSITHKFSIAGQEGYFMVGLYEDGSPGEIFIKMSKEGSTISGLMDSFAVAISMCLQYGVPLRVLVNKFSHTRFEPSGYTTNRDIPIAKSLMDYIFRWFDQKFHPNGDNGHFGKVAPALGEGEAEPKKADRAPALSASAPQNTSNPSLFTHEDGATSSGNLADAQASLMQSQADSPPCPNCGAITVRSGACYKCNECGTTTGCG